MDRASDSGSEGWGFESLPVYQKTREGFCPLLFFAPKGLEELNATVRWTVAADGLRSANLYLLPLGADANESLPGNYKMDGYFDNVAVLIVFALK